MIILGNPQFATGMKLAGIRESYVIRTRSDALDALKKIKPDDFIIVNVSVMNIMQELKEYKNVVSLPDNVEDFSSVDDLKEIIKSAVGIELNV
ncbi:hypothetical protein JXB31_02175 [Candidatus Woesearchaeota archaeon]|nr:hypothetical protein [Candidatus Woesearchaeota archaeon]